MRRTIVARNAAPRSARGQILVIVAGGLIGLLAFAGLALEGGTLVLNRRDGQNSSDLAAVAGARMVALNYTEAGGKTQADVYGALTSNMAANGCVAPAPCTWTANFVGSGLSNLSSVSNSGAAIPGGSLGVRVQVTRTPGAMLGRMLGFTTWTVSTEGTAISTKVSSAASGIVLPIAMCGWTNPTSNDCIQATTSNGLDFQTGQLYDLTDGKDAPGGFGWLSWTGSNSAGALSDSVCTPNNPGFSIDSPYDSPGSPGTMGTSPSSGETWFPVDPGKSNKSSVRSCLDGWIARGTTVLVPIYDIIETTGGGGGNNLWYHITGVAAFVLSSRDQPAVDNIQGYFVEYVPFSGDPTDGTLPPDASDTTVFIGLVK
jgi:Putative Flp pilus-assembly TadE/G-like